MKDLVEQILQNAKKSERSAGPKQRFYREFDLALQLASKHPAGDDFQGQVEEMERAALEAGISAGELSSRKKTLLWTFSQTTYN